LKHKELKVMSKRWAKFDKVKCNCGHYPKDHFNREGACLKCACTWYYPNDKHIMNKAKKKDRHELDLELG